MCKKKQTLFVKIRLYFWICFHKINLLNSVTVQAGLRIYCADRAKMCI